MPIEMEIEICTTESEASSPSSAALDPDASLVAAAKHGDVAAFEKLVAQHRPRISRLAQRITGNREDAEEVAQTSFLNAFAHLDKFRGDSRFSTWLVRIAINEARMRLRRNHGSSDVSLDELTKVSDALIPAQLRDRQLTPEQQYLQTELQHILAVAIDELNPALRIPFQLRYLEELSGPQTAQILCLSLAAVKARSMRARLQLLEWLKEAIRRK